MRSGNVCINEMVRQVYYQVDVEIITVVLLQLHVQGVCWLVVCPLLSLSLLFSLVSARSQPAASFRATTDTSPAHF